LTSPRPSTWPAPSRAGPSLEDASDASTGGDLHSRRVEPIHEVLPRQDCSAARRNCGSNRAESRPGMT
jgi:hypothetical protein